MLSPMVSNWRVVHAAGCWVTAISLMACGDEYEYEVSPPGSAGQSCNPQATWTDGCDETSVCVVQTGLCHADCDQAACAGSCSDYFSPIIERRFSVCVLEGQTIPERRAAEPHRR
jgi:hypothetical protein